MNSKRISKEQVSKLLEKRWIVLAIPLIIALSLCSLVSLLANDNLWSELGIASNWGKTNQISENSSTKFTEATIEGTNLKIDLEIADTNEKRSRGLMERTLLLENEGMLFVFDEEQPLEFWMKDTYIPLDIAFLGSDGRIINIEKYAEPLNEEARYKSEKPAKYVIELNAGWFDANNIENGDLINFFLD